MKPEELQLQFVAGRSDERNFIEKPDVLALSCTGSDDQGRLVYQGAYTPTHNGRYLYGLRVLAYSPDLDNLFDTGLIQWG